MSNLPVSGEEQILAEGPLADCSDEQLVAGASASPLHLCALHRRFDGLVRRLLAGVEPGRRRDLSQRVWFAAFEELEAGAVRPVPVVGWLERVAGRLVDSTTPVQGEVYLPAPLAWYLLRAWRELPPPMRLVLLFVEVERRSPEEIARFFSERQLPTHPAQVAVRYEQAQQKLMAGVPLEVRGVYLSEALDCLSLVPYLYAAVDEELAAFEAWRREQLEREQEQQKQAAAVLTPAKHTARLPGWLGPAVVAAGLLVAGVFALRATRPVAINPPVLPNAATPASGLQPPAKPSAAPVPARPAIASALPAPWRGRTYLLVADPGPAGLARLRRIDRGIFYRQHRGKPHVQVGLYSTRQKAEPVATKVAQLGFTPILAPAILP
ncbi:hypothetical protein [Gloeobacter morelensis]|uniref:SPOR domain-containing protein n=1 Tax=Gloeobacter morelensis MG652769 TaxID=2781736 RepID=A0ABY3PSC0_9CYAN|nr:hypothetical protein [Gloeobacter morelensis]UFP96522.1 hypothetical protein ISF26_10045 [Gloeobacter morelensis MG652769]